MPAAPLPSGIALDEAAILQAAIDTRPERAPAAREAVQGGPMLSDVVMMWLAERALKNKPRTVTSKRLHLDDFRRRIGACEPNDVGINTLRKSILFGHKAALLADSQTGKTADK
ncbi:hypothetical protein WL01_18600 [Burkholderia ubonensis]|nr:hypothetical protein WL01_18600 [Burkholderia ubonensis]KWB31279.1 hypothetical protein WL33_23745 [Burkholderia ubonensis]